MALALVACDDTSTIAPNTLNLARPVDIAFACYGGLRVTGGTTSTAAAPESSLTAQPTTSCDYRSAEHYIVANEGEDLSDAIVRLEPRPPGQQDVANSVVGTASYFGFILQSASGTVALTSFASKPSSQFTGANADVFVVDADPLTPGKNAISVGEDPVGIETDKSGCYEVVANGGSCDLSSLDVNSVLGNLSGVQVSKPVIKRLPIVNGSGQILYAKPSAIVGEEADAVVGNACPAAPSGIAYAAFPSCHMVAALDLSQGDDQAHVVAAIQFDATGAAKLVTDLAGLSCPVECGDNPTAPGATADPLPRPVTLAYRFDPNAVDTTSKMPNPRRRLAIGASNSPRITVVDLADNYPAATDPANPYVAQPQALQVTAATAITQITLENEAPGQLLGVDQIALSPQVGLGAGAGTALATFGGIGPAGTGQYVYAIASDHTVRVADVLGYNSGLTECDTQVDTRLLQTGSPTSPGENEALLQCIPVANKLARRSGARSPGIQLPDQGQPTSVAFVRTPQAITVDGLVETVVPAPSALVGTFAVISSVAGPTYIANVADVNKTTHTFDPAHPQGTQPTLLMAHQLRHNLLFPDEGSAQVSTADDGTHVATPACLINGTANEGAPHTTAAPTQTGITGSAGTGSTAASKALELPTLRQVECTAALDAPNGVALSELQAGADPATRQQVYPDLGGMFSLQSFTVSYEGQLSIDAGKAFNGPTVRVGQWVSNSTESASLNDQTRPFCSLGAEVGDIVQMHGCDPAQNGLDCPQGYECYVHAETQYTLNGVHVGSCLKASDIDQLAPACRDYLVSSRQFTVRYSSAGQLELTPRLHELRTTPLDGCTGDDQCKQLADYSVQNSVDQFDAATSVDPHSWVCRDDTTRKPFLNGSTKRCVEQCFNHLGARDADCDVGSICVGASDDGKTPGVCQEGVIPPQACMAAPQRLTIHAGEAFTLLNDQTGYLSPLVAAPGDPSGKCILDPKYNDPKVPRTRVARIPLDAPACVPGADPVSGMLPDGTFEPNPCALMTTSASNEVHYASGTCAAPTTTLTARTSVPAIKLRTPFVTLTLVDPYYPGDAQCPVDRGGSPLVAGARVPLVVPGYTLGFTISGGLTPLQLQSYSSSYNPVIPARIVGGPTGSIWVLDDGDFLSTTLGLASTQGAVYRIESRSLGILNELQ
ncbi:MAG TPA: hypothetical protein VGC42_07840 [Kofleriaceae bacterium]